MSRLRHALAGLGIACALALGAVPTAGDAAGQPRQARAAGPTEHGKASYYHARFNGRRMANGERFDPSLPTAAHKTLPLGTVVRVTNLENGRTAVVKVTDRGPYVRGRIIDLTPRTAEHLDMKQEGVVQVAVTPLQAPEEVAEAR